MSLICWKAVGWDNEKLSGGSTNSMDAHKAVVEYFSWYGYDGKLSFLFDANKDTWEVRHAGTEIRAYIVRYDVDAEDSS